MDENNAIESAPNVSDAALLRWAEKVPPNHASLTRPVLDATPQVFRIAALSSGAAAFLYHHIQVNGLFKEAGYDHMDRYAADVLGLTKKGNRMKFSRAGKAAWENYRPACIHILHAIAHGLTPVHPSLRLPGVTSLSLLPRALKNTPEDDQEALVKDVLDGKATDELEELAKSAKAAKDDEAPSRIRDAVSLMNKAETLLLNHWEEADAEGRRLITQALETLMAACGVPRPAPRAQTTTIRPNPTVTTLPAVPHKGGKKRGGKKLGAKRPLKRIGPKHAA